MISIVIPARLNSTRLKNKLLLDLGGKPVLWHTWNRAKQAKKADEVFVLTDAKEVCDLVESWGGNAILTSDKCTCGTERILEALNFLKGEIIINVQGDEPFVPVEALNSIIDKLGELQKLDNLKESVSGKKSMIVTPIFEIDKNEDIFNENVVKVVCSHDFRALYFSRSPIPFVRGEKNDDWLKKHKFFGHMGIYAYSRDILENYSKLPNSNLEECEKLEQLRFLESEIPIYTVLTNRLGPSIDYQEDINYARKLISA